MFLILIHPGFAGATALTSAMRPILIAVLHSIQAGFSRLDMTMPPGFVVSFGFILPINAPQNMVCLAHRHVYRAAVLAHRNRADHRRLCDADAIQRHLVVLARLDLNVAEQPENAGSMQPIVDDAGHR